MPLGPGPSTGDASYLIFASWTVLRNTKASVRSQPSGADNLSSKSSRGNYWEIFLNLSRRAERYVFYPHPTKPNGMIDAISPIVVAARIPRTGFRQLPRCGIRQASGGKQSGAIQRRRGIGFQGRHAPLPLARHELKRPAPCVSRVVIGEVHPRGLGVVFRLGATSARRDDDGAQPAKSARRGGHAVSTTKTLVSSSFVFKDVGHLLVQTFFLLFLLCIISALRRAP